MGCKSKATPNSAVELKLEECETQRFCNGRHLTVTAQRCEPRSDMRELYVTVAMCMLFRNFDQSGFVFIVVPKQKVASM